jgi:hypothetical protein
MVLIMCKTGALDEQARFYPQRDLSPLKAPSYTTLLPLPESFIKASNLLLNSVPSYEFASTSSQNHSSLPEISGMNQLPTDSQLSASHYHGNLNYFSELYRILELDSINDEGKSSNKSYHSFFFFLDSGPTLIQHSGEP